MCSGGVHGAGLVLNIFLALVPPVLRILNMAQGTVSLSGIDFGVVQKYFIFQVMCMRLDVHPSSADSVAQCLISVAMLLYQTRFGSLSVIKTRN